LVFGKPKQEIGMALRKQEERPGTCECRLVFVFDDEHPELGFVLSDGTVPDEPHAQLSGQALLDVVRAEGRLMSGFLTRAQRELSSVGEEVPRSLQALTTAWRRTIAAINARQPLVEAELLDGLTNRAWREGTELRWSFDLVRNLVVDAAGLPANVVAALQTLASDAEFGGKVIVNG
jgi:hypothetical protein